VSSPGLSLNIHKYHASPAHLASQSPARAGTRAGATRCARTGPGCLASTRAGSSCERGPHAPARGSQSPVNLWVLFAVPASSSWLSWVRADVSVNATSSLRYVPGQGVRPFPFARVFDGRSDQRRIYDQCARPAVVCSSLPRLERRSWQFGDIFYIFLTVHLELPFGSQGLQNPCLCPAVYYWCRL